MNNAVFGKTMENTDIAKDAEAGVDYSYYELETEKVKVIEKVN